MMSRAAQTHLAGRVFETPALVYNSWMCFRVNLYITNKSYVTSDGY